MICHEYATIQHALHTTTSKRINIIKSYTGTSHHQTILTLLHWFLRLIIFLVMIST